MNSLVALIIGIGVAALGYFLYAGYIERRIIKADSKRATPATLYMDGVDFIPTSKYVLFGYQFKSIAALGPVLGPIIALQWGWLPALLWIFFGTFFLGWVQDYASAIMGLRKEGQSFGALSYQLISPRARLILLSFLYFYLLLIVAAFGNVVATMMASAPAIPAAIIALMVLGILSGLMIYKGNMDLIIVTILMVVLSIFSVWLGTRFPITQGFLTWVIYALFFSYLGAVLPIWSYTQPINYISFYLVFIGIVGASLGILIGHPDFSAPAYTTFNISIGPLWPVLFVTIACGAISGWHSLVSSSGTARQLENEIDARPVAAGAMFLEMILALLALIFAASFPAFGDYLNKLKTAGPAGVFAEGMSNFLGYLRVPRTFGTAFAGAIFVILAITVMQLVVRFMRVATAELAGDRIPLFRNMHTGAIISLLLAFLLIHSGTWQYIWVLFGASNQLMAALAFLLISLWLLSEKKPFIFTFIPMVFMFVTTISALFLTSRSLLEKFYTLTEAQVPKGQTLGMARTGNLISALIGMFLIVAALLLLGDGLKVFFKPDKQNGEVKNV